MKKIVLLLVLLLPLLSCQKVDEVIVKYVISDNASGFLVNYINEEGVMVSDAVINNSAQDTWSYAFTTDRGQIIFISAISKDINDGIKVSLIIDGKTFKQGSSNNDTTNYVTVSGTVPYN